MGFIAWRYTSVLLIVIHTGSDITIQDGISCDKKQDKKKSWNMYLHSVLAVSFLPFPLLLRVYPILIS